MRKRLSEKLAQVTPKGFFPGHKLPLEAFYDEVVSTCHRNGSLQATMRQFVPYRLE
jgi:hypothetical protein